MSTIITELVAREHIADLRRAAEQYRAVASPLGRRHLPDIELRVGNTDDAEAVRRLAELDDAAELEGQVLLALIDGDAVAGLSLRDQRVVANPFIPTRDAISLLRLRAEHSSGGRTRRGLRDLLRRRSRRAKPARAAA